MMQPRAKMRSEQRNICASAWAQWKSEFGIHLSTTCVAALLAAMAFFSYYDPLMLGLDSSPSPWLIHRPLVYAAGFLAAWILTMAASALNAAVTDAQLTTGPKGRAPD